MENAVFLQSIGVTSPDTQAICLEAMAKYEDNHWWEPDTDPRKYAYYQLQEDTLLGSFSHFHESLELLLGRPVWTHELGISRDTLIQEAQRAWTYQVGVTSEVERQEKIAQSMESPEKWGREHGKQVIHINVTDEE